jgi:hypothetical protein
VRLVRLIKRRLLTGSLMVSCLSCEYDPACKAVVQHAPELRQRLTAPEEKALPKGVVADLTRLLTPAMADRLLKEAEAIERELPASARAEDLNMLLGKLANRRSAFEQALRDFLVVDPSRLDKGLDSGTLMPLRRGVEMSRNAMLNLADTATELCRSRD